MTTSLFRHEALEEQKKRLFGEVVISQPFSFYLITFSILLVVSVVSLLLAYGTYTRKESVFGYIVPEKGLIKVYAPIQGVLAQQYFKEGDSVKKGDLLFRIKTLTSSSHGADRDTLLLIELREQKINLTTKIKNEKILSDSKLSSSLLLVKGIKKEIQQLEESIHLQNRQLELLNKKVAQYTKLVQKGHLPNNQLDQAKREKMESEVRLNIALRQKTQLVNRQNEMSSQISEMPLEWHSRNLDYSRALLDIEQRIVEISGRREYAIRAPVNGHLAALQIAVGQTLNTQSPLVAILPEGTKLQAELFLPTRAAGFIAEKQEVSLRYAAFPFQHYGLHSGSVSNIAQVILSPNELPIPVTLNEPVYRVKIELERQTVLAFGKEFPLQAGMLLDADIILEKRSLGQWLLEPIYGLRGKL